MQPQTHALLETDLMQTFVAIAEEGGFTAAASRVHRTPSAISMQMKRLEEQLGRPLFVRKARLVDLTPDGEALLVHAREMLRVSEAAISRFRKPELEGSVRLGAVDDYGARWLPRILSRFAATHAHVEVSVTLASTRRMVEMYDNDELDLALVSTENAHGKGGAPVFSEPLVWVGARSGAAISRDPLPLALSQPPCGWRGAALRSLGRVKRRHRVAYTTDILVGQIAAVESDLAIAPMPASLIPDHLVPIDAAHGLGDAGQATLTLLKHDDAGEASRVLAEDVIRAFSERRR